MSDEDQFFELITTINSQISRVKRGAMPLSEYYDIMADFFDYLWPASGIDHGGKFNFKQDAVELRQLSKIRRKEENDKLNPPVV